MKPIVCGIKAKIKARFFNFFESRFFNYCLVSYILTCFE